MTGLLLNGDIRKNTAVKHLIIIKAILSQKVWCLKKEPVLKE